MHRQNRHRKIELLNGEVDLQDIRRKGGENSIENVIETLLKGIEIIEDALTTEGGCVGVRRFATIKGMANASLEREMMYNDCMQDKLVG